MIPEEILAATLWAEDRSGGKDGMEPIAGVILTRAEWPNTRDWWGDTVVEVCLKAGQFSCWWWKDPNFQKLLTVDVTDSNYADALEIAHRAITLPQTIQRANGATHYHAKRLKDEQLPAWAFFDKERTKRRSPCYETAHHYFYAIGPGV